MRIITTNDSILTTDDYVVFNSASNIFISLYQSVGNGHSLTFKNTGAGDVYLSPVGGDYIDAGGTIVISQWESVKASDDSLNHWLINPNQVAVDIIGVAPTSVSRTNNPIVNTVTPNANIDKLDAAIGADFTPVTRTTGQTAVSNTINQNVDALDSAIGFDAQMSTIPKVISKNYTVYQNLDRIDTYCSIRTIKVTVGNVGVTADFNFVSAADKTEQPINLGALLPSLCRVVDITIRNNAAFTNLGALGCKIGLTTGTDTFIASTNMTAVDTVASAPNAGAFISTPVVAAQNIWLSATPANNWDSATPAGKLSVYLTIIDVTNI